MKYKVLESIVVDGTEYAPDSEVELTEEKAVEFEGKVEAVAENNGDEGEGE